jgi:hypothetical protein
MVAEVFPLHPRRPTSSLPDGGGPPYDGSMEARVATLEEVARNTEKLLEKMDERMKTLEDRQHSDFRWLISFGIAATAAILGTMAHGFHWL